jgi:hypothetical protein
MQVSILKDTELNSSNVAASTEAEYASGTSYASGATVKVSFESDGTTPRTPVEEYESLEASNQGNYPPDNPTKWSLLGASNKWKMFDGSTSSQTENTDSVEVELDASDTDSIGILNMDASSVELYLVVENELIEDGDGTTDQFTKESGWSFSSNSWICSGLQLSTSRLYQDGGVNIITDLWVVIDFTISNYSSGSIAGYAGGGIGDYQSTNGTYRQIVQIGSDNTYVGLIANSSFAGTVDDISIKFVPKYELKSLAVLSKADYYEYFFDPFDSLSDIIWYYPRYGNSSIRVNIEKTGTVKCGLVVYGATRDLGLTEYNPTVGILDYSIKSTDSLGRTFLAQGNYADRIDLTCYFNNNEIDSVSRTLTSLRGIPALWDCNNNDLEQIFESLFIYGYFDKFDILIPNFAQSQCNIRINGLT